MAEEKAEFYAHSKEGVPPSQWQRLEAHLSGTAKLAAAMAGEFGSGEWGYVCCTVTGSSDCVTKVR